MVVDPELVLKIRTDYEDEAGPGAQKTARQLEQAAKQMSAGAPNQAAVRDAETLNGMILTLQRERMSKQQRLNLDYQQSVAKLHQVEQFSAAEKERVLLELNRTHVFKSQALQKEASAAALATAASTAAAVAAAAAAVLAVIGGLAYGAVSIIQGAVERAVRIGEEANTIALRLNLAADQVSAVGYAAGQTESSLGDMAMSLRFLSVAMNAAAEGSKEQAALFRRLGVEYRDATGALKDPLAMFVETATAMKGVNSQAELAAVSIKLFGRSADEMLPLIRQIEDFKKSLAEARAMGFVVSPAEAALADEFADRLESISRMVDALARSVAAGLLPALNDLAGATKEWWAANHAAVTGDVQLLFEEIAALLRAIGAIAQDSSLTILDGFRAATAAGLALVGVLSNAAAGFYRLQQGAASAKSMLAALSGNFEAAGRFAAEANRAGEMAGRLQEISGRTAREAVDVMSGAAERMRRQAEDAAFLMEQATAPAHTPWQPSGKPIVDAEAARKAQEANKQLDQAILAAAQARLTEEERLLSEYLQAVKEVNALEYGSRQKKEEAVYQLTLTYHQKRDELLRKEADAVAAQWRDVQARIMGQEQTALDARNQQIFEGIQAYNAAMSDMAIAAAGPFEKLRLEYERDVENFRLKLGEKSALFQQWLQARDAQLQRAQQAFALGQQQNRLQLEAEITINRIEMDKSIPEQLRRAYAEVQRAQAEVQSAQLGLEMATQANDTDAAATAVLKLAAAYQKLDAAQKNAKKAEKETKAMTGAMQTFGQAIEQSFMAAAYAAAMSGENMAKAIAGQMKAVAVQELILGIVELAKYWGCLFLDPPEAGAHLTSSNLHFLAAAMAGGASAIAGAASGGGGGGGEGNEQKSGPREYTQEDLARLRGGGQDAGTSGGGSASDTESGKQTVIINNHTTFKNANDSRDIRRYEKKMAKIRAEATLKHFARNAYQARQMARLQAGEY